MFVLLLDAFALGLVMIAALFVSASFDGPAVQEIRWATFATLGAAPLVFLAALLNVRLARSAVGDLVLELRAEPVPADLRDSLARALRDPLWSSHTGCPISVSTSTSTGSRSSFPSSTAARRRSSTGTAATSQP